MPINEYDETLQELTPAPTPASPSNPYEQTLEEQGQAQTQKFKQALAQAEPTSPDRAAQIQKLSQRTGLPADVVDRNFESVQQRARIADTPYSQMLRDSPVLTNWMTQQAPVQAAVAKDDLENLGMLEWLMTAPKRAWQQGQAQVRYGFLRHQELTRDLTADERQQLDQARTEMQAGGQLGAGSSWFRGAVTGAAQNLPNMLGAYLYGAKRGIPAAVTAGTAAAGYGLASGPFAEVVEPIAVPAAFAGGMAAGMFTGAGEFTKAMESGLAYDEYLNFRDEFGRPLDRNVAKAAALATGYANATLEAVGLEFLFKSIPGIDHLTGAASRNLVKKALRVPTVRSALLEAVKSYGETLTAESSVEVAQRAATIIAGELAKATGATQVPQGQLEPGNVNLYKQPTVQNADGTVSTVDSVSINIDGKEVLIPRVTPDGRHLSTEEAVAEYRKTGKNLGTFDSPDSANAFAEQLHKDYAAGTYNQPGEMRTPSSVGADLLSEGTGAVQAFALTIAPGPIGRFVQGLQHARSAQANVRFFQALGEGVAQSKTGQRDPAALQSFLEAAGKDGPTSHVYADVDTWTSYWQEKGLDPAEVATEVTGSRDAYEHALNTGEQLEIPTSRYAVKLAATEHNAFWVNELRLGSPDEMNGRESDAFKENITQLAATHEQPSSSSDIVRQQVTEQLTAAGFEPRAAESIAGLYESSFGAMAGNAGVDPLQVYGRYGLTVQQGEQTAAPTREAQPATQALPLPAPVTNETGQLEAPGDAGTSATTTGTERGSGGESAAAVRPADQSGQKAATAPDVPPPARALPATPADVATAVAATLGPLQATPEASTLSSSGKGSPAQTQQGEVGSLAGAGAPGPAAAGGGADLQNSHGERGAAPPSGSGDAGGRKAGARASRAVRLPEGYAPRFSILADGARRLGFTGSDRQLSTLFRDRLDQARQIARDLVSFDSEQPTSLDLLSAIAKRGGLGIEAESAAGMRGELENMLESLNRLSGKQRGRNAGKSLPKEFRHRGSLPGAKGIIVRKDGVAVDSVRESINEDPRWAGKFENLSDFLSAVDDAIRIETGTSEAPGAATFDVDGILKNLLDVRPESTWWAPATEQVGSNLENNGSGESAASVEAMNRDASMKARDERFVVYDRTGQRRLLIGVDAVDYVAQPGETFGVEGPQGFRTLDDRGGKAPAATTTNLLHEDAILNGDLQGPDGDDATFDISEFDQGLFDELSDEPNAPVDTLTTGEKQPRLPGDVGAVRDQEVAQPQLGEVPFSLTAPEAKPARRRAGEERPPSEQYLAAKAAADAAGAEFTAATKQYRAREIDDATFLAAKAKDAEAQKEFDRAFMAEQAHGRSTTTLFQSAPAALTRESLQQWVDGLKQRTGPDLSVLDVWLMPDGALKLAMLAVDRGAQRSGLGSAVMRELTQFADANGARIILSPASRDREWGTTSRSRLVKFYKRFGFVENKGRNTDFALSESMYRDPSIKAGKAGLVMPAVDQTKTREFKDWFGTSQVVDDAGKPLVVYHGTTHDITEFDRERGNLEADFGAGIYFSNTPEDVSANYAGVGPDLTGRITQRAEEIANETNREYNDVQVIAEARAELVGDHEGAIVPVYVRMENPAILGGNNETKLTFETEFDAEGDVTGESGTLLDFVNTLRHVASHYDDGEVDGAIENVMSAGMDDGGMSLREAIERIRSTEQFNYYTDEHGKLISNEILRQTIEEMGHDGIIDATVDKKFGSQRRVGRPMAGMHADTVHYIAFGSEQVKSAIGNRGTFSRSDKNILHQEENGQRRGFIRFGPDRQMNIGLLERADLSTFLHETGHFYLEVFGDLADQVGALPAAQRTATQNRLVEDYKTLLGWFGVDDRQGITASEHEKFARGFEAYLMEGKAPSIELRSAFARFRSWLVAIYKSVNSLHVALTPDVRRVLDRMVASDKAIFAAEQEGNVQPMFTTPESAGMTDTQFGLYRAAVAEAARATREKLERRVLGEVHREQTAEWKRRREEIRSAVEQDVNARPVYQALAAIQKGTHPDGQALVEGQEPTPMKLDRKTLVDEFGRDRLQRLPRGLVEREGHDPALVARTFGYSSTDELLTALEHAAPSKAVIEHETTQRMMAEHGSILLDGSMHDRAREAVATDDREALIRAEMRALGQLRLIAAPFVKQGNERLAAEKQERAYERRWMEAEAKLRVAVAKKANAAQLEELRGQVRDLRARARGGAATIRAAIPSPAVLEQAARERLAAMRVQDIAPARFWSASRQAAQRALDLAARQDFAGAIVAKQQELINTHLYRQSSDLRDEIDARVQKIREQLTTSGQARLGKAGGGYLEQYRQLAERYSFTPASGPQLERLASLRSWMNEREAEGLPIDLPEDVVDDVRRTPYQQLTTETFQGVADALDNIAHVAQLERRRLKAADDREFYTMRDDLVTSIDANNVQRPTRLEFTAKDERSRRVSDWFASHSKLSFLARALDGYKDAGALWDAIVRPLNAAADEEFTRKGTAGQAFAKIIRTAYGRENLSAKLYIPAIGNSLSHEARVAVALQWGNADGRERLLNDPVRKWNREQILAVLDTLDKRDWDFVQGTWNFLDTFWPEVAAKQERVTGLKPEKVLAATVDTKFGEYPGGYYPLAYDGRMVPRAEQAKAASEAKLAASAAYVRTTTRRGHTEARKRSVRLPVRLDLSVAFQHVDQVIHDLTHHEALIDVTRTLRDGQVSKAIVEHAGDVVYQQFTKAVQDIALGYMPGRGILDTASTWLRTRTQLAMLGWNLWTALQQPLGVFNGAAEVGPTYVARGMRRWLRDAASMENTARWVNEVSPFMRERANNLSQDLNDLQTQLRKGGWFDKGLRTVSRDLVGKEDLYHSFLWHIGVAQRVADMPTWLGAYEKFMEANAGDEARAIALADQAVRNAQGGGSLVDLAQVQRGGPIQRLWLMFYSYGNVVYNQTKDAIGRTDFKSPGSAAALAGNLTLIYAMPAFFTVALGHAFGKLPSGDDVPAWLKEWAQEEFRTAMNTMVGVRELAGLTDTRGYSGPAGARAFDLMTNFVQQVQQGKVDEAFGRALNSLGGSLLGYPALQMQRTADGIVALEDGTTHNPLALLVGPPPKAKR